MSRYSVITDGILKCLNESDAPMRSMDIADILGEPKHLVRHQLNYLTKRGKVHTVGIKNCYGGKANLYRPGPDPKQANRHQDIRDYYLRSWYEAAKAKMTVDGYQPRMA